MKLSFNASLWASRDLEGEALKKQAHLENDVLFQGRGWMAVRLKGFAAALHRARVERRHQTVGDRHVLDRQSALPVVDSAAAAKLWSTTHGTCLYMQACIPVTANPRLARRATRRGMPETRRKRGGGGILAGALGFAAGILCRH